mgnify:CR=1 FL=1
MPDDRASLSLDHLLIFLLILQNSPFSGSLTLYLHTLFLCNPMTTENAAANFKTHVSSLSPFYLMDPPFQLPHQRPALGQKEAQPMCCVIHHNSNSPWDSNHSLGRIRIRLTSPRCRPEWTSLNTWVPSGREGTISGEWVAGEEQN